MLRNYDWKDLIKFYEKSLKYFPYSKTLLYNYSMSLLLKNEYQNALFNFEKLYKFYPEYKKAISGIAKCYFMLGKFDIAETFYRKINETDILSAPAFTNMAIIYEKKGEISKAIEFLDKAINVNKNYQIPYILKGKIYFNLKNYEISEEYFRKAIELNPDDEIPYFYLGVIYFKKKRYLIFH
jgi:tetratricopeptide (TPR) repeat protein